MGVAQLVCLDLLGGSGDSDRVNNPMYCLFMYLAPADMGVEKGIKETIWFDWPLSSDQVFTKPGEVQAAIDHLTSVP